MIALQIYCKTAPSIPNASTKCLSLARNTRQHYTPASVFSSTDPICPSFTHLCTSPLSCPQSLTNRPTLSSSHKPAATSPPKPHPFSSPSPHFPPMTAQTIARTPAWLADRGEQDVSASFIIFPVQQKASQQTASAAVPRRKPWQTQTNRQGPLSPHPLAHFIIDLRLCRPQSLQALLARLSSAPTSKCNPRLLSNHNSMHENLARFPGQSHSAASLRTASPSPAGKEDFNKIPSKSIGVSIEFF